MLIPEKVDEGGEGVGGPVKVGDNLRLKGLKAVLDGIQNSGV